MMRVMFVAAVALLAVPASAQMKLGTTPSFGGKLPTPAKIPKATLPADRAKIFMKLTNDAAPKVPSTTRRLAPMKMRDGDAWLEFKGVQTSGNPYLKSPDGMALVMKGNSDAVGNGNTNLVRLILPKSAKPALVDCTLSADAEVNYVVFAGMSKKMTGSSSAGSEHAFIAVPPSTDMEAEVVLWTPSGNAWWFYNCEITPMG